MKSSLFGPAVVLAFGLGGIAGLCAEALDKAPPPSPPSTFRMFHLTNYTGYVIMSEPAQKRAALDAVIRIWNKEAEANRVPVDEALGVFVLTAQLCKAANDGNMGCPK